MGSADGGRDGEGGSAAGADGVASVGGEGPALMLAHIGAVCSLEGQQHALEPLVRLTCEELLEREVLDAVELKLLMEGKPLPEKTKPAPPIPPTQPLPGVEPKPAPRPELRPAPGFSKG